MARLFPSDLEVASAFATVARWMMGLEVEEIAVTILRDGTPYLTIMQVFPGECSPCTAEYARRQQCAVEALIPRERKEAT